MCGAGAINGSYLSADRNRDSTLGNRLPGLARLAHFIDLFAWEPVSDDRGMTGWMLCAMFCQLAAVSPRGGRRLACWRRVPSSTAVPSHWHAGGGQNDAGQLPG
jgi:hypothetical protein